MINRTRAFFHSTEDRQIYLQEWRSTTFARTIKENPDKDLSQCFDILVNKLQKIFKGLAGKTPAGMYRTDEDLAEQMLNACQGVEACKLVAMKPASTFESVVAELRDAIGVHMRFEKASLQQYNTDESEGPYQYWVDRRYEGGRPSRGGFTPNQRGGRSRDDGTRNPFNKIKKCFVCGKQGCWSTKHPIAERQPKKNQWRRYMQAQGREGDGFASFLIDFEGVDTGELEEEQEYEAWVAMENAEASTPQMESFVTEYGPVDGTKITNLLNNQATMHAITEANPLAFNGCILTRENDVLALKQKKQGEKLKMATNAQEYVEQRARGAYIASIRASRRLGKVGVKIDDF